MGLLKIYEGWTKSLGLRKINEEEKKLAAGRVKICIACPHSEEMWLKKFIDGLLQRDIEGSGIGCTKCNCPVNEKTLVTSETCPDGRW